MKIRNILRVASASAALLAISMGTASAAPATDQLAIDGPTVVSGGLQVGDVLPESDGVFSLGELAAPPVGRGTGPLAAGVVQPRWTHAWNFSGSFKASLSSSKFDNVNNGEIRVEGVNVTNCTPGYSSIKIQLIRVNLAGAVIWSGTNVNFPCNGSYGYNWGAQPDAGYRFYFSRSGPVGHDENTKSVTGTAYYG